MKFLVTSDIHGNRQLLERIVKENSGFDGLFFLGDGLTEFKHVMSKYPDIKTFSIPGNCDIGNFGREGAHSIAEIEGFRIFYSHGDTYSVKIGFSEICSAAHRHDADIVLFGHTHIPCNVMLSNLHLFNPGALGRALEEFSYGIIELQQGKKPQFKHVIVSFDDF